ncbi:MAG: DEAD/DEAH box helicase [Deltaproteobacteria bacterium]|nr:DEAD/DEAH box helicase [Deltaproteobacteria bacterium]
MEPAVARIEENEPSWQPLPGQAVQVRGRPAAVLSVVGASGAAGSLVEVAYTDGAEPGLERLLWRLELGTSGGPGARSRLRVGPPSRLVPFRAAVRAARWEAPAAGVLTPGGPLAPLRSAVRLEEHQMVPLIRALSMPRVRLMLADDVGLGKTIEAGLIAAELVLRRQVRRILVLCPPALRRQWQDELRFRFGLELSILDRQAAERLGGPEEAFSALPRVIVSPHWLSRPEVLAAFRSAAARDSRGGNRIDLLVVDEAHHFLPRPRGSDSDLVAMLREVVPWSEHRLFLSATPHDGFRTSFTGLLEILDPLSFRRTSAPTAAERQRMKEVVIRRLKRELPAGESRFPSRRVTAWPVVLPSAQERLFAALREAAGFLRRCGREKRRCTVFLAEVLSKRLLSSVAAFASSFAAFLGGLEKGLGRGVPPLRVTEGSVVMQTPGPDPDTEVAWLQAAARLGAFLSQYHPKAVGRFDALARALAEVTEPEGGFADARIDRLADWIEAHLRRDGRFVPDEKVVVFTSFVATLQAVRARFAARWPAEGDSLAFLSGATGEAERCTTLARFSDPGSGLRVLVTTDVAAEGLNLQQAARYVFHHDIPWNPAVLEQRVGRVDRIGQGRPVRSFHFVSPQSQEMRLLSRVVRKTEAMEQDLGRFGELIEARVRKVVAGSAPARVLFPVEPEAESDPPVCSQPAVPGLAEELTAAAGRLHLRSQEVREGLAEALSLDGAMLCDGDLPGLFRIEGRGGIVPRTLAREAALCFDRTVLPWDGRGPSLVHPGTPLFAWMCARLGRLREGTLLWTAQAGEPPPGTDAAVLLFLTLWAENRLREPLARAPDLLLLSLSEHADRWRPGRVSTAEDGEVRELAERILACAGGSVPAEPRETLAGPILAAALPLLPRLVERRLSELATRMRRMLSHGYSKASRTLELSCRRQEREIRQAVSPRTVERLEEHLERLEIERTRKGFLFAELASTARRQTDELREELDARERRGMELLRSIGEEKRLLAERLPLRYSLAWPPTLRLDALAVLVRQGGRS